MHAAFSFIAILYNVFFKTKTPFTGLLWLSYTGGKIEFVPNLPGANMLQI